MINLDFLQFNQANLLFFVASALGLVRERRVLPFFILAIGNLIHGGLAAALLAALILWHRIDVLAAKPVQFKDSIGLFFVFIAMVSPEPVQSFSICMGALFISLSFGCGGLGVMPAVLMLRQFAPEPADLEILMGIAGVYWVTIEVFRFAKVKNGDAMSAVLETVFSLGILFGLKEFFLKWFDDPVLLTLATVLIVSAISTAGLLHFRREAFLRFFRETKERLAAYLTIGGRLLPAQIPWNKEPVEEHAFEVEKTFDRLLVVTLLSLGLLGAVFMMSRGGF